MEKKKYAKLSEITEMTIGSVLGWSWKHWCQPKGKMLMSEMPTSCDTCKNPWDENKGKMYDKRWALDTDHGIVEVSKGQLGQLLELIYDKREGANLEGHMFLVGNNGKQGKDIRYWFKNADQTPQPAPAVEESIDDIDF